MTLREEKSTVSLLIPVYNAAKFLPELLRHATTMQTLAFNDVILYDDASTDDSAVIIESFPVRLIKGTERKGPAFGRNALLAASQTSHVHFHDADDPLESGICERVQYLTEYEGAVFPFFMRKLGSEVLHQFEQTDIDRDPVAFFLNNFVQLNAMVFPARLLKRINGFYPYLHFCEDRDVEMRIAQAGATFRYFADPTPGNVPNGDSLTAKAPDLIQLQHGLWFLHRCYQRLPRRYYKELGYRALEYAWHFFYRGDVRYTRLAIALAQRFGVKIHPKLSGARKFIAEILGNEALFWLQTLKSTMTH
jgi:glycosyltransferase involved in cell wall biosynthesis